MFWKNRKEASVAGVGEPKEINSEPYGGERMLIISVLQGGYWTPFLILCDMGSHQRVSS